MPAPNPPPQGKAPPFPRFWAALLLWGLLLLAALYGPSLTLPFFSDDLNHLPYLESTPLAALFYNTGSMAYYRPLSFALWRLMYLALGEHSAFLHHLLNLLLYLADGLLVAWLAATLWRQQPRPALRALLSATLFWLYPFSYQAVPWSGAVVHILLVTLLLLALAGYLRWQKGGGRGWLLLSLAATVLAPFTHENGVLVGPAVFLTALAWRGAGNLAAALKHGLLWLLPALLWLPIWWLVPKGADTTAGFHGLESMAQNGVYLLQGMAYPLTFLGGWLVRRGVNDMLAVLLLALPALALAALVQGRTAGPRRLVLFPWLWCALAWAPALVMLGFDYVVGGSRLLLLASVGIAWLWADVAVRMLPAAGAMTGGWRLRLALVSGSLFLVLLASAAFIHIRMGNHLLLGAAVEQAVAVTTAANASGREAAILNFPAWVAPGQRTFAVGAEGVVLLPGDTPHAAVVASQNGAPAALRLVEYTDIRVPVDYNLGVAGGGPVWAELAEARAAVFEAVPVGETVEIRPAGLFDPPPVTGAPLARFDGNDSVIHLLAAEPGVEGGMTVVTLTWRVETVPAGPLTVFVHLLDEAGPLIAQDDGYPLAGTYPFLLWVPGQVTADVRLLTEPGAVVMVGIYDPVNGQRLAAYNASGELLPDGAVRVGVR